MPHQDIIRNLTDTHRNMERVITFIRFQVDSMKEGDDPAALTPLGNAIVYMRNYPGVNHHPTEDIIFSKLARHSENTRKLCAQLSEEHQQFGRRESNLLQHIRSAQGGDTDARRQVQDMGVSYCLDHSSHIRNEEMDIFPQAVRRLSPADWREISRRSNALTDPDLERMELKRYDNLYDRLMSIGNAAEIQGSETA